MSPRRRILTLPLALLTSVMLSSTLPNQLTRASELIRITESNFDSIVPAGKEVDAIFGDWILRNDSIVAVLAQPVPGRKANMTVRGVSGMLIDFTRRNAESDQLSCFYPASGRYLFEDPAKYEVDVDGVSTPLSQITSVTGKKITISASGRPVSQDASGATISYSIQDRQDWLEYTVTIQNNSESAKTFAAEDSLRCDGNLFITGSNATQHLLYAFDQYFGQAYGFIPNEGDLKNLGGRNLRLRHTSISTDAISSQGTVSWGGKISCSQGLPGIRSWAESLAKEEERVAYQLKLQSAQGPVPHAVVALQREGIELGNVQTDETGMIRTRLLPGEYVATIQSFGREDREHPFTLERTPQAESLTMVAAARVRGTIVDGNEKPIPAKIQFIAMEGTPTPDFGPDSAISAMKNVVYTADGKLDQPITPGKYQVIISHGPEYDADTQFIEVFAGKPTSLKSVLPHTVDTTGWVSGEFHSHSTPSGDNVSHQLGRVFNLLAEHIEFAPCTEHNRIETYSDDLEVLGATKLMATCTGMELTGSPLPINHQNAFPLHRHPHTQDGGGPDTDSDPVKQIERLALWDEAAPKVVQTNHPNIPQILGDKDLNGVADDGFRGMLGWMDVIEVHPPQGIFTPPDASVSPNDKRKNPIFFWMQLLNLGYRIPGVVNTDAHYNFHGSGWYRNYLVSSADEPENIETAEMIHSSEHGHMVMTSGPFLQAEVRTEENGETRRYISGDQISFEALNQTGDGSSLKLWIRVQCPNWFDINRVQVFANGRPLEAMNFQRNSHSNLFGSGNVRFEHSIELPAFEEDTHLIVATIGEGLKLGPVMGEDRGELPPVAVANPIFIDVDGSGFQANGDNLGIPFMLPKLPQDAATTEK